MQPTFKGVLVIAAITTAVVLADRISFPVASPPPGVAQASVPLPKVTGNASNGRSMFAAKGCAACHVARGVPGAVGTIGPSLNGIGDPTKHPTLVDGQANTPENVATWLVDPPARKPGTQMPNLGLSQKEADDLAAFLVTLR